jgi:rhomboid protease GluP
VRGWLRHEGDEYPVDLADLDVEIRQGMLPGSAELRYDPWTRGDFRHLSDIPELSEAFDAPDARFAAHLRTRRRPWFTTTLTVIIVAAAIIQVSLGALRLPEASALLARTFGQWMVGLEPTLLDGRWWTPWTAQLTHADLLHALFNAPIIAYCGYRVEQALAPSGTLAVVCAAVVGGAVLIIGFDSIPVIGSSIIAYGLWGAQIAIGLRMGEAIPEDLRGRYGMGNLIFFAPLYAASLFNPDVSHLGHAGGLIGGGLVAVMLSAETMAPAAQRIRWRLRVVCLSGLLALSPVLLLALAARVPALAYAPYQEATVTEAGVSLSLPVRFAEHPISVGGMAGWRASVNSSEPIFADLFLMENESATTPEWLAEWWGRSLSGTATIDDAPEPLGPGWTVHALSVQTADQGTVRVIEHQHQRGRWLVRAGYYLRPRASAVAGREALYRHALTTIEVHEPPTLLASQERLERNPTSPSMLYNYARELHRLGRVSEADTVYGKLDTRSDGWQWDAARARLQLWLEYPDAADIERRDWLLGYLDEAPGIDATLHRRGMQWLVARGDCATARRQIRRLSGNPESSLTAEPELIAELADLLSPCRDGSGGGPLTVGEAFPLRPDHH